MICTSSRRCRAFSQIVTLVQRPTYGTLHVIHNLSAAHCTDLFVLRMGVCGGAALFGLRRVCARHSFAKHTSLYGRCAHLTIIPVQQYEVVVTRMACVIPVRGTLYLV